MGAVAFAIETFYALDSTLRLAVGEREADAPAGCDILVSLMVLHTLTNKSEEPARFFIIDAPSGWEHFLRNLAKTLYSGMMPGAHEFVEPVARYHLGFPPKVVLRVVETSSTSTRWRSR
jgi:hypothetical protein